MNLEALGAELELELTAEGKPAMRSSMPRSTRPREWIDRNANGPLTLSYSISLKLTPPEGETIREIGKTTPMFPNGTDPAPKQKRHRRTKAEMQAAEATAK